MALQPRLDLRQSQSLVMTPQLQQAIKLLQLSNLELSAFVEQELERNPLLERDDGPVDAFALESLPEERRDAQDAIVVDTIERNGDEAPLDIEFDNSYDEGGPNDGPTMDAVGELSNWSASGGGRTDFADPDFGLDDIAGEDVSLRDHLIAQLNMGCADPRDRMVGMALIDGLDEAGRLAVDLADLADGLGTTVAHVEAVLAVCREFEPTGIFACTLQECLALQLREKNRLDPAMEALLDNLDLLARRDFAALKKVCGVDGSDLQDMIGEIKELDPKPAQRFGQAAAAPVIPDVLMRLGPAGAGELGSTWIIELNPETLPRVLVNNRYYARISRATRSKEEKAFITENYQTANWLAKSLDQRANTILKTAAEIVRQQRLFFERGVQGLRPLILRDVAEVVELHESTVSRVTSNKYISTPRGVFELKYFFTQSIAGSDGGEAHSAEAVRHRIRALIDAEAANAILSDDSIVDMLKKDGVDIARRTVAKYREAMRIPSSVQRRREKLSVERHKELAG